MKKSFAALFLVFSVFLILALSFFYKKMIDISRPFPVIPIEKGAQNLNQKPVYYCGVISRFPPTFIYRGYQPIMDYLTKNTPFRFELRLSKSYKQTVEQLASGQVVAAFLGSFIFAKEAKKYGLRCLLRPLSASGHPFLRAVVITKSTSDIHKVTDLIHKKIALPSALSFSANWFLYKALPRYGLKASQLDSLHWFAHHHTVIYEVLKNKFDAGVVKDRVAQEFVNRGIRILDRSEPIPSSPLVVSSKSPVKIVRAIKQALLKINVNKAYYRKIVAHWDAEFAYGFASARNEDYYDSLQPLIQIAEAR